MGQAWSFIRTQWPGKPQWTTDQVPDLAGKVVVVTGGNTGLGKETARVLLGHNAKVYITARTKEKGEQAVKDLKEQTGKDALLLQLDLANLKSIKASAEDFLRRETQLHVLYNNAGVMNPPIGLTTADGYDLQFGTNVIGHFYFTKLLLPLLTSTAQSTPDGTVRVVNLSSGAHKAAPLLDFNTFKDGPARRKLSGRILYGQSKFGNIVYSNELARRYRSQGIVSIAVHPGVIATELFRHLPRIVDWVARQLVFHPVSRGALTQLRAGTDPQGVDWNGKYLVPWGRLGKAHPRTDDEALGKQLWEYMEEQVQNV